MIRCIECGAHEPFGALFCGECGAPLLDATTGEARSQLPFADDLVAAATPSLLGQDVRPVLEFQRITFVIPSSGRRVEMGLGRDIRIGRAGGDAGDGPELDLSRDNGIAFGVSRTHAVISRAAEGVTLLDSGSTNGTYLNNYRIPADLPYPLRSGDELKFGELLVHVFLE